MSDEEIRWFLARMGLNNEQLDTLFEILSFWKIDAPTYLYSCLTDALDIDLDGARAHGLVLAGEQ